MRIETICEVFTLFSCAVVGIIRTICDSLFVLRDNFTVEIKFFFLCAVN